jgi:transcription initiation factor IIE alpha subunit
MIIRETIRIRQEQLQKWLMKIKKKRRENKMPIIYVCPMHSEVKSDKPGKCSKCGMNLKAEERN